MKVRPIGTQSTRVIQEAVYGVGEEAMCERIDCCNMRCTSRADTGRSSTTDTPTARRSWRAHSEEAEWGYRPEYYFPANAEDAARLDEWLNSRHRALLVCGTLAAAVAGLASRHPHQLAGSRLNPDDPHFEWDEEAHSS